MGSPLQEIVKKRSDSIRHVNTSGYRSSDRVDMRKDFRVLEGIPIGSDDTIYYGLQSSVISKVLISSFKVTNALINSVFARLFDRFKRSFYEMLEFVGFS